jgi:hypothetical protein
MDIYLRHLEQQARNKPRRLRVKVNFASSEFEIVPISQGCDMVWPLSQNRSQENHENIDV